MNLSKTKSPSFERDDEVFLDFEDFDGPAFEKIKSFNKHTGVKPVYENVWKSIRKCDVPRVQPEGTIFELAMEYALIHLGPLLRTPVLLRGLDYVPGTSPGKVFKVAGYKTKQEAINSPLFREMWNGNFSQVWSISGKVESLPSEEVLMDRKIRTFMISDVDFVLKQKMLWGQQDRNILKYGESTWIRYGMMREYGGVDRMFQKLHFCTYIEESDISGYDRCAYLGDVYKLRRSCLVIPPDSSKLEQMLDYVVDNTVHSILLLPDGNMVVTNTGNRSGSGTTTTDNCIKHVIIKFYHWIRVHLERLGRVPTYLEIVENVFCNLFGDDNLSGSTDFVPFVDSQDYARESAKSYSHFGLIIKPSSHFVERKDPGSPIGVTSGHPFSFLGVTGLWSQSYGKYFPQPRRSQLCFSISRYLDPLDDHIRVQKVCSLVQNACMDPELFPSFLSYARYLYGRYVFKHDGTVTFKDLEDLRFLLSNPVAPKMLSLGWEKQIAMSFQPVPRAEVCFSASGFYFLPSCSAGRKEVGYFS